MDKKTDVRTNQYPVKERIEVIDALRGFALFGIMLIHGVEHFSFFHKPEHYFLFTASFDHTVRDATFFMISQKAYSIFALMFGISFHIQMGNQRMKGNNFNLRFAWRLTILLLLGMFHTFIYNGDILFVYATLGFLLIPINKLNTKRLWVLAILFAIQIPFIIHLIRSFWDSNYVYTRLNPLISSKEIREIYSNSGFFEVLKTNIIKGKSRSIVWSYNTGRYYQLVSLFILGIIIGRNNIFNKFKTNRKTIFFVLSISFFISVGLWLMVNDLNNHSFTDIQKGLLKTILNSYYNLSFTTCLIALFSIAYIFIPTGRIFKHFAVYGRMSLTNYLLQTILGIPFFYGCGLAMYKYMGYTWGLIYGLIFSLFQIVFSHYWFRKFHYGPVEWLWRALTFFNFKLKFKKI